MEKIHITTDGQIFTDIDNAVIHQRVLDYNEYRDFDSHGIIRHYQEMPEIGERRFNT